MSDFHTTALDFIRTYREFREFPALAKRLAALSVDAGPADRPALEALLRALGVPAEPGPGELAEFSSRLEGAPKSTGEHVGAAVKVLASNVHLRYSHLDAATKDDPAVVLSADFGPRGTGVFAYHHQSQSPGRVAYGILDRLPPGHRVRAALQDVYLPSVDGEPAVMLGRPVVAISGAYVPAATYALGQVIAWTRQAGQVEKERIEKEEWERAQEEEARKARAAAARRPFTVEQLTAVVEGLQRQVADLKAAGRKEGAGD